MERKLKTINIKNSK